MTNAERIKEIKYRAAKATVGPWAQVVHYDFDGNVELITIIPAGAPGGIASVAVDSQTDEDNAALIANAPFDIAFLLSTLRAVEADNARLRGALEVCVEVLCESANLNNYRNLSDEELGRAWMTAHTLGTAALQDPRP